MNEYMEWLNKELLSAKNEDSGVGIIRIPKRTKKSMKWCDHGFVIWSDVKFMRCGFCNMHLRDGYNYESGLIRIPRIIEARKKKDKELGIVDVYNPYMTKEMENYE